MTQNNKAFEIKDYGKKSTFASFLPGISGIKGIPIWCYYVNRGQGVVSFGVDNKDHAIMEFYPAHQAYQNVKTTGFRTFIKKDGVVTEPFANEEISHNMTIGMNSLKVEETNSDTNLRTTVQYFTLPGEKVGALVRKVTVENLSCEKVELEVLDGMPALIPYGVSMENMKNMCQTAKAWMQVEDAETGVPYFRVRASIEDTTVVRSILGGNFSLGYLENGARLCPIVDPTLVFGYDTSMRKAVNFENKAIENMYEEEQIVANHLPCSFYGIRKTLPGKEAFTIYEVIGQVENKSILEEYAAKKHDKGYFASKEREADNNVAQICKGIATKTASEEFDAYCSYTYMDNVLRGGYPLKLGKNKIFYAFSRKHGDLERDYNYFSMLPEFYSQGNGNFRDVNQNRRCDTFFAPFVARENIKAFYSLIQLDGYNPLSIEKLTYCLPEDKVEAFLQENGLTAEDAEWKAFLTTPFTPGALYRKLDVCVSEVEADELFEKIMDAADSTVNGNFGEGYWCDHWTYNLDLIQDYLEVFPEQEKDLLTEKEYTSFLSQININHRQARYVETENGLRQYRALNEAGKRSTKEKLVRTKGGEGEVLKMTLAAKLVLMCATKFAALDAYGMGIEMEGGKPGWYDALNGMPAMFGSSMSETYELCRMLEYTIASVQKYDLKIELPKEVATFVRNLDCINKKETVSESGEQLAFWNKVNDAKEAYRDIVYEGVTGEEETFTKDEILEILKAFLVTVKKGIEKACVLGEGICPTYFTYEVTSYEKTEEGYQPLGFKVSKVPYFLEGPVRYLKLNHSAEEKRRLYKEVKNSDLYDEKLSMYKVNASLLQSSYEYGRARAFTPGWLENESIWLHMEYKYLLELLKSGMYKEFFEDFKNAAVPFLDPEVYGRSIYENSSFIASSKNPNKAYHGKGFVARLSGSTIEFISMWKLMMFGKNVLSVKDGALVFTPQPTLPAYLIPEDGLVKATLFGNTEVTYRFTEMCDYVPGSYEIKGMQFTYRNGNVVTVQTSYAGEQVAKDIRNGLVQKISIEIV